MMMHATFFIAASAMELVLPELRCATKSANLELNEKVTLLC